MLMLLLLMMMMMMGNWNIACKCTFTTLPFLLATPYSMYSATSTTAVELHLLTIDRGTWKAKNFTTFLSWAEVLSPEPEECVLSLGNIAVVLIRVELQEEELRVVETYAVFLKAMLSNASRRAWTAAAASEIAAHAKIRDFHSVG